ncbi:hypothetical protein RJ641_013782 [Dillenia turbinata]|uniref:Erythronate-4-phosphate dehydrogenase family protein n=1 Tax=Dillenia turbinata TaxID=194707 RepID=A0AAN8W4R0_9MAGN
MENSYERVIGNPGLVDNERKIMLQFYQPCIKVSLPWLDLRVFYVRISKCEIDDSTPENLTLNHVPLDQNTLLEVNGVRTSIYSDGASTLLRRDRLDKKSEEATFVCTDNIRMSGSVKFEVFDKDVLVLSGVLEMNDFAGEVKNHNQKWSISCESDVTVGTGFLKSKHCVGLELASPIIEVYVAGSFSGAPIIFSNTLQVRKKQLRKGMLNSIPEYEPNESHKDLMPGLALQKQDLPPYLVAVCNSAHPSALFIAKLCNCKEVLSIPISENYKPAENEDSSNYPAMEYIEGEDGELSWFNAGVRVGVGIGLGVCLGVGIGVGLLVRTYQGTTRNFRRRLL